MIQMEGEKKEREREETREKKLLYAREVAAILLKTRLLKNLDRPRKSLENSSLLQGTANPCLRQLSRKRRLWNSGGFSQRREEVHAGAKFLNFDFNGGGPISK